MRKALLGMFAVVTAILLSLTSVSNISPTVKAAIPYRGGEVNLVNFDTSVWCNSSGASANYTIAWPSELTETSPDEWMGDLEIPQNDCSAYIYSKLINMEGRIGAHW